MTEVPNRPEPGPGFPQINASRRAFLAGTVAVAALTTVKSGMAQAQTAAGKPNILIIWGDDIGTWNISHNNRGMMGYMTPNIDRVAQEGLAFTDYYAQQSCTAGRAAFLNGTVPLRTGQTKVGIPGAAEGWSEKDVTIAAVLKGQGYATGQFGKNHQGDRDEHLPTNHGFDEFLGPLYHLNASEEPENEDWPEDEWFNKAFTPRGVIKSSANADGTQTVEDTGPLTKLRMETIDEETLAAAKDFITRKSADGTPFFCWWNGTRMHFRTHVKEANRGISGQDEYSDGMVEHDGHVGELLTLIDELGLAENTIVMYSTDNGPHYNSWPDAGTTPFRSEKNSNWEGAYRVPAFARWPGKWPAGKTLNGIVGHEDWLPTLAAAAGNPDVKDQLLAGTELIGRTYRNYVDGKNMLDYFKRHRGGITTRDDDLCERRCRDCGRSLPRLEGGLQGKPGRGVRGLARALRRPASAVAVQPPTRTRSKRRSTTRTPTTTGSLITSI